MKNTRKKLLFICGCLWLCISIYIIQTTYAKYYTKVDGSSEVLISAWNIKVNNQDITTNNNLTACLTPTFSGNEYTNANVIVPGVEGYFDLTIDTSLVTTPCQYTITITKNETNNIDDLIISNYSLDSGTTKIPIVNNTLQSTILPEVQTTTIRVYLVWDDSQNATLTNIQDTAIALSNGLCSLTTNIIFEQIVQPTQSEASEPTP